MQNNADSLFNLICTRNYYHSLFLHSGLKFFYLGFWYCRITSNFINICIWKQKLGILSYNKLTVDIQQMYLTREKIASSFYIIRSKNPDLKSNSAVLSYKERFKLKSSVKILTSINSSVQQWNSLNSFPLYLNPCKIWISFQTLTSVRKAVLFVFLGGCVLAKIATELFWMKL